MPHPYDLTTYEGRTVDWFTRAALEDVAHTLGYPLTVFQGSYNAGGVSASAGTHDGGGAVDLAPFDHARKVLELRRHGFAAWYRPASSSWNAHIHAVLIGNRKLSAGARSQVAEYLNGYDGLAGDGRDTGPRQYVNNRYRWDRGVERVTRARTAIDRALNLLRAYTPGTPGVRGISVRESRRMLREAANKLPGRKD